MSDKTYPFESNLTFTYTFSDRLYFTCFVKPVWSISKAHCECAFDSFLILKRNIRCVFELPFCNVHYVFHYIIHAKYSTNQIKTSFIIYAVGYSLESYCVYIMYLRKESGKFPGARGKFKENSAKGQGPAGRKNDSTVSSFTLLLPEFRKCERRVKKITQQCRKEILRIEFSIFRSTFA